MKPLFARYLIAVFLFAAATFVVAGDFQSMIVMPGTPLPINVPDDRFLVIRNFTQQGGTSRGVVTVTNINGQTANVLAAAIIDSGTSPTPTTTPSPTPTPTPTPVPLEVINNVVIAGPATVTVTCGADATSCFVSYRKDSD